MKVTLSALARINLAAILAKQRVGVADIHLLNGLLQKVRLSTEEQDNCLRDIGGGQAIVDTRAVEAIADAEAEMEKAEARKLRQVLREWPSYGPDDLAWLDPILRQLEAL